MIQYSGGMAYKGNITLVYESELEQCKSFLMLPGQNLWNRCAKRSTWTPCAHSLTYLGLSIGVGVLSYFSISLGSCGASSACRLSQICSWVSLRFPCISCSAPIALSPPAATGAAADLSFTRSLVSGAIETITSKEVTNVVVLPNGEKQVPCGALRITVPAGSAILTALADAVLLFISARHPY